MSDQKKNTGDKKDRGLEHDPGLAGRLAKAFIVSPLTSIIMMASFALGLLGLMITPRQEDPQISVPMVDIFVQFPGASSDQVATMAVEPLERVMSEIEGVEHVYSSSMRGQAIVTVEFEVGEDMEPALVRLYSKLASNLDIMPPGVMQPLVKPKGVDDVPVMAVTLWSKELDDAALHKLAGDVLQRVEEIEETGPGFIVGGRKEQIRVNIVPAKLASYGVTLDQIAGAIKSANSEATAGEFELSGRNFKVYSGRFLQSAEDVSSLVVGIHNGSPVYLGEVADVSYGPEETHRIVRHFTGQAHEHGPVANGEPAVTIAVAKKKGTNGVDVTRAIREKVELLKGWLIPDNVNVTYTRDYGKTAQDKVNELIFKLFVATGAVVLLILIALGLRPAIVAAIVIPIVILFAVFGAWVMGMTIDRVSLFAMIFSIGILVDDAVVVVENIYRRWLAAGKTDIATAVDAVREVGNPTIIATFTVVAALLPMAAVRGMMGPYMAPIPKLGTVAMIFSLFAAFVFTPWLVYKLRPTMRTLHRAEKREQKQQEKLGQWYGSLIRWVLGSRIISWLTLLGILVLFGLSCFLFYTQDVTVKLMPYDNKPEFNVVIDLPAGTALTETASVTSQLVEKLRQGVPEIVDLQSNVGTASPYNFNGLVRHYYLRQNPWQADIQIKLLHKEERERTSHQIAVATREMLTPIARKLGAKIAVVEMPPGPPVLQTVVAEVYGPTPGIRRQVARDLEQVFGQARNIADENTLMEEPHPQLRFVVDRDKAMRKGITEETINRTLMMTMGGFKVSDVKLGRSLEPTHIVIQAPLEERAIPSNLSNLPIPTPTGATVPLHELGQFIEVVSDPIVFHKDLRSMEWVTGEVTGRLAAPIYAQMEVGGAELLWGMIKWPGLLKDYVAPDGVKLKTRWTISPPPNDSRSVATWDGEWRVTYITFRDMGVAFMAAILLIYILVVVEFKTFLIPLIIISPIPLTLIGIVPGHWIWGAEFTATSMIGFIALAGIIVRNSILLVDFAREQIANGVDPMEAVIKAGQVRMRPIVLTAVALMLGVSVILSDPIFQGMAVSLFFGVFVATLLTLIVIPMGCISCASGLCPRPTKPGNDGEPDDANGGKPAGAAKKTVKVKPLATGSGAKPLTGGAKPLASSGGAKPLGGGAKPLASTGSEPPASAGAKPLGAKPLAAAGGAKPLVRGGAKPLSKAGAKPLSGGAKPLAAKGGAKPLRKTTAEAKPAAASKAGTSSAKKPVADDSSSGASSALKTAPAARTAASKPARTATGQTAAKKAGGKKSAASASAKPSGKKPAVKKPATKKAATKKAATKKAAAKKTSAARPGAGAKKAGAKSTASRKPAATTKKAAGKKAAGTDSGSARATGKKLVRKGKKSKVSAKRRGIRLKSDM